VETFKELKIRLAKDNDLKAITTIEELSYDSPWTEDFILHEIHNPMSNFYVLELDNEIIGYIDFWILGNESHIANIAIHPDSRRMHYGKKLLDLALDISKEKKVEIISLEVNEKNLPAISLYKSYGFVMVGRRPKYYNNKDDALILTRKIK
jgi:ribosomal-protein-alanine N-acetyltransferase